LTRTVCREIHFSAIIRVDREEKLAERQAVDRETEDFPRAIISGNLPGLKIAIPSAESSGLQSKAQALLAVTQSCFSFNPRVHIS